MFHLLAHRRHAWIAILAILWHGLLPLSAASAIVPAQQHAGHSECGAAAHHNACATHDNAPAEHGNHHQNRAHCALCFFDNGVPALHDARNPLVIVSTNTHVQRETATPHSHTVRISAPPPSRAPPLRA